MRARGEVAGTATLIHVDVFAGEPLTGNPLAVFIDPPALSDERYRAWAREMNLSETTFAWPRADGTGYDCRIFTPERELPFAGHPTLGTAWALCRQGLVGPVVKQHTAAGVTSVTIDDDMAWMVPPMGEVGREVPVTAAADALGIPSRWISPDRPPQVASAGLPVLLVHLEPDRVAGLRPPADRLARTLERIGVGGVMVWAFAGAGRLHVRVFGPGYGIAEDPATGSAAAALGVYLQRAAGVTDPMAYELHQGAEVGRPSILHLRLNDRGFGELRVGGRVVPVFEAVVEAM
jgi:trans-2,3-dihydro-3-hydroxyanthranilate isomerase